MPPPTAGGAEKKRLTTSAMIASFADPGQKTAPAPFGHALAKLAEERPEIVGLSADLAKYTDMHIFRDAHPDRFFQMGMAEQAMLGAAAGMAEVGLVPFASTYSVFATRRAYDFLCLDIAEPNLNVNIVGALPGLTTGYGPSHQATEDLAILRGCPNLTIVDPCDSVDIEQAVPQLAAPQRPHLPAAAPRRGAHGARRVRLPLPARQGRRAAHRPRRRPHLHRPDDHAGVAGRGPARGRPRRRRGAARADDQAPGPRGDPARRPHRPARRHAGEPHRHRRARPRPSPPRSPTPGSAPASCRSRCPTSSSPPAPCPPCTTATGCRPTRSSAKVKAELDAARPPGRRPAPPTV